VSAPRSRFADHQQRFFEEADAPHFFWQTRNPHFADTERALLRGFPVVPGHSILEVGCGEGGNLVNLLSTTAAPSRLVTGRTR
jgi:cyclopropane fatty-acyl-phospholipid synthase-like methyltransferase